VLAGWLLVACGVGRGERVRPHVFLISSDTLRADHLSKSGYPRATSPALDAFARRAWDFTESVTVIPKTGPSFATMFTGRHPQEHGVRSNFDALPPSLPVLAERLREAGYETAAFVGNPALRSGTGFARGFDRYEIFDGKRGEGVRAVHDAFRAWAGARDWEQGPPVLVWIHYMDPHGPYTPPAELERPFLADELARSELRVPRTPSSSAGASTNKVLGAIPDYQQRDGEDRAAVYVGRYDAEIRYMDAAFADALAFLEERGLYESSALLFTSDHGEALGEHDEWFEHGWFASEATLRVPLILKPPGPATARVVAEQVSNLDLYPTLLALAGLPADPEATGANLLQPIGERGPLLIENSDRYPVKFHGVRTPGWKYLVRESDGAEELYDLRADPRETRNLAATAPPPLADLREACTAALRRARAAAVPAGTGPIDDPATLERLRELGYVRE
jgi:arylsulfatase A-like enzyme